MRNFFKILGIEGWRNLMTQDDLLERLRSHSADRHYVYVIWRADKPNVEPMYVGKGKGRRVFCHLYKSENVNRIKSSILQKMRRKGFEPIFSIIGDEMTDDQAIELEISMISEIGRIVTKTGPLANITAGGEGQASTRARGTRHGQARAVFANHQRFDLLADAARALGVYPSAIHKRINAGWPGYYYEDQGQLPRNRPEKHSPEHIAKMRGNCTNRSKKVVVDGVTYRSFSAAAKHMGVSYSTIRKRCLGGGDPKYQLID